MKMYRLILVFLFMLGLVACGQPEPQAPAQVQAVVTAAPTATAIESVVATAPPAVDLQTEATTVPTLEPTALPTPTTVPTVVPTATPEVVELAPSLTPLEIAQFNPDKDLVVWDEGYAQAEGIKYLNEFVFVNPKGQQYLGLHVSDEGINWVDKDRFNLGMELVVNTINEQGLVAIIDKSYVDVNHPDAYKIATNADGTPRVFNLAHGEVLAQLSPGENLVKRITVVISAQQPVGYSGQEMLSGTWDIGARSRTTYFLSPDGVLTAHMYIPPDLMKFISQDWEDEYDTSRTFPLFLTGPASNGLLELPITKPDAVWEWYTQKGNSRAYKMPGAEVPPFQSPNKNPHDAELRAHMMGTDEILSNGNDYNMAVRFNVFHE